MLASFVPWIMLNRDGLDVLLHPETGDEVCRPRGACGVVRAIAAAQAGGFWQEWENDSGRARK